MRQKLHETCREAGQHLSAHLSLSFTSSSCSSVGGLGCNLRRSDPLLLQRRTVPATEPAASVWTSRAAAGAPSPATRAKASASRAPIEGPFRPSSRPRPPHPASPPARRPPSTLACAPARPNTTGPSSTAQVRAEHTPVSSGRNQTSC